MNKKALNQLKTNLQTRRDYLLKEIKLRLKEFKDSGGHRFTDTADIASNITEEGIAMSVAQGEAREIKQIDFALKRLNNGKYGLCDSCGKKINKERLKAIPSVNLCIKCKEAEEREEEIKVETDGYYGIDTEGYGISEEKEKGFYTKHKSEADDINPNDN
ncbi:MAG: TraR/DksA family transcriptional regulator [Candidatus Scalinduaceae bacterium]